MVNGVLATLIMRVIAPMTGRADGEELGRWEGRKVGRLLRILETAIPLLIVYFSLTLSTPPSPLPTPKPSTPQTLKPSSLRVALIQRNASCIFSRRDEEDPIRVFIGLLDKIAPSNPDLVVLAESAFTEFGSARSDRTRQAALHFANRCGGAMVIGGADDTVFTNGVRRVYNAAACYSPAVSNALVGIYHKQHLVPFGEYIPFDKWITPLQKLSPIGVSLHPGEPMLFDLDGIKLAPLICFEASVTTLVRESVTFPSKTPVIRSLALSLRYLTTSSVG